MKVESFRSSDFNVEDRLRTDRPGRDWQVQLREFNISNAVANFRFKDRLNQPGEFNFELLSKPFDPEGGERVFIGRNGELKFSGFTRRPSSSTMREDRYQGVGGAMLLDRESLSESDFDDSDLLGTNTDDFVQMLFDSINIDGVSVGVNTRLNQVDDTVDVRVDDDTALEVLNRIVLSYGGDWYVSFDKESAEFKFNIEDRVESTKVVKTFEGGTDNTNIEDLKDEKIIDEEYDAVFVKGYGDGDDQVKGFYPEKSQWPNNPRVLSYTDKTIISESVAEETAENLFEEHSDWRSISLVPAEKNQPLDLGDKVKIEDENTGINEEFRIVQRKISVDYTDENIIEYVLNDKPVGLLDEVQDVSDITRSQTDYMQGSRNIWSEKEVANCSDEEPLEINLQVPEDITDKVGENKVSRIELNYKTAEYRQDGDPVSSGTFEIDNIPKKDRVESLDPTFKDRFQNTDSDDLNDNFRNSIESQSSNAVKVEEADISGHGHDIGSTTSFAEKTSASDSYSNSGNSSIGSSETLVDSFTLDNSDALVHRITFKAVEGTDNDNLRLGMVADGGTFVDNTLYNIKIEDVASSSINDQDPILGTIETYFVDSVTLPVTSQSGSTTYEIRAVMSGVGDSDLQWRVSGAALTHEHDIPKQERADGDTGAVDEDILLTKAASGETRFESEEIESGTADDYIVSVSDNTEDDGTVSDPGEEDKETVEDVEGESVARVDDIDDQVLVKAGVEADEIDIEVEKPDGTIDTIGNFESREEDGIDLTASIEAPGWYIIRLTPDQVTNLKARVFLDHHKDSK